MKLGFVSAILPDLSLSEVLNFTASEGFSCVELMCWPVGAAERRYAGVTHLDVTELSDNQASELNAQVADLGIEISGLGYYPNPLTPNPEEAQVAIDQIGRIIKAAPKLGVNIVNTFIGRDPSKSIEGNWPRFLEVWRPLVKLAEENGVRIAIENCPMYFSNDEWPSGKNLAYCPEVWRRMFHDISSDSFGLNYDPSHFLWQHIQEGPALIEFASKLFHVHAKDARVDQDRLNDVGILGTPLQYHTPKLPGLGNVNWSHFFSILSEQGYTGPVCIEVEDRPYEKTLESRKGALRQSQRFLKQFMTEELA
jgi:sugar phosphate isomerase/epimerase